MKIDPDVGIPIDLIYVEERSGRTMSVGLLNGDKAKLLGPVPSKGAFGPLAEMLINEVPGAFDDLAAAQRFLTALHFKFMEDGKNAAGQDYPYTLTATN